MQPRSNRVAPPETASPTGQDEEGGLERVLSVVRVAQEPPADAQDYRTVAGDQDEGLQLGQGHKRSLNSV